MDHIWEAHTAAFTEHPVLLFMIVAWGCWYMSYKVRSARAETDGRKRHEHRKRVVIGGLTMACGILFFPGMAHDWSAQLMHQKLGTNTSEVTPTGPSPIALPDTLDAETYYDKNDWYFAELLAQIESDPDLEQKCVTMFTNVKDNMQAGIVSSSTFNMSKNKHEDSMGVLDLMRCLPYAAHGYEFKRPIVRRLFEKMPWYHPTTGDLKTVEAQLSEIEKANIKVVTTFERQHWNDD